MLAEFFDVAQVNWLAGAETAIELEVDDVEPLVVDHTDELLDIDPIACIVFAWVRQLTRRFHHSVAAEFDHELFNVL